MGEYPDISAAGLSAFVQAGLRHQIGVATARKAMDVEEQRGEAMVDLIRAAAELQKSGLEAANGRLDLYA